MKRLLATAAAVLLMAVPAAGFAADTPQTASQAALADHQPQGPDFSACEELEGQLFGQCVAEIAQSFRDDQAAKTDADAESETAEAKNQAADAEGRAIAGACAALSGQKFGECVSAAAQKLNESGADGSQGDEHASAVAAAAQKLVDSCQAKDGREFGECVSAAAQELGELAADEAAQAEEHGQGDAHRSDNAPAPGSRGQSDR